MRSLIADSFQKYLCESVLESKLINRITLDMDYFSLTIYSFIPGVGSIFGKTEFVCYSMLAKRREKSKVLFDGFRC